MGMPVEWYYLEKDAGMLSTAANQIGSAARTIGSSSAVQGGTKMIGNMAGQIGTSMALGKVKEHNPGGYE